MKKWETIKEMIQKAEASKESLWTNLNSQEKKKLKTVILEVSSKIEILRMEHINGIATRMFPQRLTSQAIKEILGELIKAGILQIENIKPCFANIEYGEKEAREWELDRQEAKS